MKKILTVALVVFVMGSSIWGIEKSQKADVQVPTNGVVKVADVQPPTNGVVVIADVQPPTNSISTTLLS